MIRKALRFFGDAYRVHREEVREHTIRLQRSFSACVAGIFFLYTAAALLMDRFVWQLWNPKTLWRFSVSAVAAANWLLFRRYIPRRTEKAVMAGNAFLFVLLELLVILFSLGEGCVSATLIISAMLATAVVNLHPGQYLVLISIAKLSEMAIDYVYGTAIGLPAPTIAYYFVDAVIVLLAAVCINILISSLQYRLFEEKSQLRKEAAVDPLTGLYTRKYFERFFQLHHRTDELSAMIHIDLDNFKTVNDTLGHKAGDELLSAVADILRGQFRKMDCVARVGGDEFMVFMASLRETKHTADKVQQILNSFPIAVGDVKVSVSIGVAFSAEGREAKYQELYEQADAAMYCAKNAGKGRAVLLGAEDRAEAWLLSQGGGAL